MVVPLLVQSFLLIGSLAFLVSLGSFRSLIGSLIDWSSSITARVGRLVLIIPDRLAARRRLLIGSYKTVYHNSGSNEDDDDECQEHAIDRHGVISRSGRSACCRRNVKCREWCERRQFDDDDL